MTQTLEQVVAEVKKYAGTRIDFKPALKLSVAELTKLIDSEHEVTTLMGAKRVVSRWCRAQIAAMPEADRAAYSMGPKRQPKLVAGSAPKA